MNRWPLDYLLTPADGGMRWTTAGVALGAAAVAALFGAAWGVFGWTQ
jgi:hypothetical protein